MKDYTKFMNYALFTMIDRKTQDDGKSKIKVEALFSHPCQTDKHIFRTDFWPDLRRIKVMGKHGRQDTER